jgi:uncharacterized protein with NRDE domain
MCLVVVAYKVWNGFPIVIAANRDEFFERPARKAGFWEDDPNLLAGRDLSSNGTWLGVTKQGRMSFVTNRRDMREPKLASPVSRGKLVEGFLKSKAIPIEFQTQLLPEIQKYEGFNLFFADQHSAICLSNRGNGSVEVEPGFHTLSNAFWNTKWPKTERVLAEFRKYAEEAVEKAIPLPIEHIFTMLNDSKLADVSELPDTGIGLEREKYLSAIRISLPGYGTRVSTIVAISESGECLFYEKTFEDPFAKSGEVVHYKFDLEK